MTPLLEAFSSKNVPHCLWSGNVLSLPDPLASAHTEYLTEKGWKDSYAPAGSGAIGGATEEEAREHVTNRFLNSAARMQFVCIDPRDEQSEIREAVLDQLAAGALHLIDLAAGNGAGTLAILSLVCQLRKEGALPTLPLNVYIHAIDYSAFALAHFSALNEKVADWIKGSGIHVELSLNVCDLMIPAQFNEALEDFFSDAKSKGVCRFLCTISAVSGLKKDGMESISDSLKNAAAALGHSKRTSTWLWVEPGSVGKGWFTAVASSISLTMKKIKHKLISKDQTIALGGGVESLPETDARKFSWSDPINGKVTHSQVLVFAFRNS